MRRRNILLTVALVVVLVSTLFLTVQTFVLPQPSAPPPEFYVGVQCGYDNVTLNKMLIDKVKNYTNLFIIGATDIVKNATLLNEVADYAYAAGLHFSMYFSSTQSYLDLSENLTTLTLPNGTIRQIPSQSGLPLGWLKNATAKYGDRFLGAYVFDEPAGKQLDGDANRVLNINTGEEIDYAGTTEIFLQRVNSEIQPYLNASIMTFTSDYSLYWFDYKAGFDMVLTEFGGHNTNRQLQASLCRGAATVQNKDWGIMVTHRSSEIKLMESGMELYNDLVLGYDSGAKYAVVFDYSETEGYPKEPSQPYEFGILQDEHFDALKNFWTYVQQNPSKHGSLKADVALVLPENYGFGMRAAHDKIWGIFDGDFWSQTMWSDVNNYLNQYGSQLDIVYNDAAFNSALESAYNQIIYWSASNASTNFSVRNLNTTFGYPTIQEAINSGATTDGQVLSVKPGTYRENLVVNKSLSIIGEDKATTIIDGGSRRTAVTIARSGVEFSGFTVKNSGANGDAGILLSNTANCNVTDNIVTANYYGISLNSSTNITLNNNALSGNVYSLSIDGNQTSHFLHNVDGSNTVNGKKVYYLINAQELDINPSAYPDIGYLALVNSTGINVQGLSLSHNGNGILLVDTQNSTLTGNAVANSVEGIRLLNSENNTLRNNHLSDNRYNFIVQNGYVNNVDASNTVQGRPVYYWVNEHDKTVPSDAGFVVLVNSSGITIQNFNFSNNWQGIVLSATTDSIITHNQINGGIYGIVLADGSNGNMISTNDISGTVQGLAVSDSNDNHFTGNTIANNQYGGCFTSSNFNTLSENVINVSTIRGILFSFSDNNSLTGNQIDRNNVAVEFVNSSSNTMTQNRLASNNRGIQVHGESSHISIAENNIANSTCGVEIALYDLLPTTNPSHPPSSNGIYEVPPSSINFYPPVLPITQSHSIAGNMLTNNQRGILVGSLNDTEIIGNSITGSQYGITVGYSSGTSSSRPAQNNTVKSNTIAKSSNMGIYLSNAYNNSIIENNVTDGQNGISLSSSEGNRIIGNSVANNKLTGIQLASSSNDNVLRGNKLDANGYGFGDDSLNYGYKSGISFNTTTGEILSQPKFLTNDMDASNTINGKVIYYWVGQTGKTVPSDAGIVILVNCSKITVQNLNLTGNYDGIQLAFTNDSIITSNIVQNNSRGIRLLCSSNNNITNNNILGNGNGIQLEQRSFTTGIGPNYQPLMMNYASTGNLITGNSIESNTYGVSFGGSMGYGSGTYSIGGNTFYHNNFFHNKNQVNLPYQNPGQLPTAQNSWDNGKEGNYWSDYNGTDTNHDGIGDSPYEIKARSSTQTGIIYIAVAEDHFPLMQPLPNVP